MCGRSFVLFRSTNRRLYKCSVKGDVLRDKHRLKILYERTLSVTNTKAEHLLISYNSNRLKLGRREPEQRDELKRINIRTFLLENVCDYLNLLFNYL